MRYIKDSSNDFALALTKSYLRHIKAVIYPLQKLNIRVFIVSDREVKML